MGFGEKFAIEEDGMVKVRTCAWSPPGDHPVGCGLIIHVKDGKMVKVEGDPDHPVTQGRLCPRTASLPGAATSQASPSQASGTRWTDSR